MLFYYLEGKKILSTEDVGIWGDKMEVDRTVHKTNTSNGRVSTVFLGVDHSHLGKKPPILFETMVFGGTEDEWQQRYATWDEAVKGHMEVLEMVAPGEFRLISDSERFKGRSEDYYLLTAEQQWEQDKLLGILDWNGQD